LARGPPRLSIERSRASPRDRTISNFRLSVEPRIRVDRCALNPEDLASVAARERSRSLRPTALGGRSTSLGGRITPLGGRITPLGGRSTALGGRITPLGGRSTALGGRITPLGGRSTALGGRSTALGGPSTSARLTRGFRQPGPGRRVRCSTIRAIPAFDSERSRASLGNHTTARARLSAQSRGRVKTPPRCPPPLRSLRSCRSALRRGASTRRRSPRRR
jgi:hypothetical protein